MTSEAPDDTEVCWQSRSLTISHEQRAVTIHTQEVAGSSPAAPTIRISSWLLQLGNPLHHVHTNVHMDAQEAVALETLKYFQYPEISAAQFVSAPALTFSTVHTRYFNSEVWR